MKGFQKLTSVDDALHIFLSALQVRYLKTVTVSLVSALNRVLVEDIIAKVDLPRFDRSAVDGYAVRAEDTVGATQFKPKTLQLTDRDSIGNRQAKHVWTGTIIPERANAVVMLEDTSRIRNNIEVCSPVTPGENVSKKGEDIMKGETAAPAGTRLSSQHLGLIAALGISEVNVVEKPKIGVLATGNELVKLGGRLQKNQIFEVNRLILSSLCSELGAEAIDLGIAKDDVDEIMKRLKLGLDKTDAVITSGGTSVGSSDLVPDAVNKTGKPGVLVHGVAMRPGMPTGLAVVDGKPILILPGNPVAAMLGFEVFGRPLIFRMLGLRRAECRFDVQARITRRVTTTLGRRNFVRVLVFDQKGQLFAKPISARGSSLISTMTKANGYVVVPENREGLEEGECVSVQMFDVVKMAD